MTDEHEQSLELDVSNIKLTDWQNEPSVRDLKKDLEEARTDHQDNVTRIDEYLDNLHVRGKAKVDAPKGRSRIVPKLIRKQAEWRYAALSEPFLSTDNLFKAKPVTWADKEAAQQSQVLLNSQFNFDMDKVKFIDEYVRTLVDEGTAILKTGWDFQEEEYTEQEPEVEFVVNPELAPLHEELAQMYQSDPNRYFQEVPEELQEAHELTKEHGQPIEPKIVDYQEVTKTRTLVNRPTIEICDYRNIIIDPTCKGDIDKASFVIHWFESSLSELEKDGKYTNLDQINANDHSALGDPDYDSEETTNFKFTDKARKKIVVYEYWGFRDLDGSGVVKPFVAAWVGDTKIRMEENPFPDQKLPFELVQYLPKRRESYGEPDGALLEDNQKVLGAVTRGMIDIMGRSANGQQGMRKDALDAINKRRWRNGENYEFNPSVDPRQGMYMHTFPEIPNSAMNMVNLQNMEAESLTGVKSYNQGVSGQALGDVAAGVRGALDAASKRELGILRRLSNGLVRVAYKIMAMNREFLDEEEVVRMTDDQFVQINRDSLAGKYDLFLDITTAEEDDKKAQELAFMLQTVGPDEDPGMRKIILSDIARLRKMPELAKRIADYEPQPDPLQQRIQQLEIEKLQWEIEVLKSEVKENYAEAAVDQAKAAETQSKTDLNNLNFVEQESGVKQERDLERQGAQAEAQARTKIIEHNLKEESEVNKELRSYISNRQ